MRSKQFALLAAAGLAMLSGLGAAVQAMPAPRNGSNRGYKPRRVALVAKDTARAREIAEHNAAVDRRKAEKKARKLVKCKARTPDDARRHEREREMRIEAMR